MLGLKLNHVSKRGYWACDYLSMLGLNLIHVSESGPRNHTESFIGMNEQWWKIARLVCILIRNYIIYGIVAHISSIFIHIKNSIHQKMYMYDYYAMVYMGMSYNFFMQTFFPFLQCICFGNGFIAWNLLDWLLIYASTHSILNRI